MEGSISVFTLMNRRIFSRRLLVVSFALTSILVLTFGRVASTMAQDPITIETLGAGAPSDVPGKQILLLRVTLQPGAEFPAHIHPGALVISVQSGDFTFVVISGEADATRAVATGTPEPAETLAAGQEEVFHAGDAIFEQAGVVHTAKNNGSTPAVVLVAGVVDPTQPFLQPVDMQNMGTPAA
jgi:quercetin dioxygenase-like cupin family protein